jgi:outer membrane protein OmpA-like peptidoglycan-associated protein
LDDYDVKGETNVKFKVSSFVISKEDMAELKKLADSALGMNGYIIEVKGFTDASGSSESNDTLSENRAKAVVRYLVRECNVPVWRIVAPAAMGEFQPAASNETAAGKAENRRVEVKILVNKAVS